MEVEDLLNTLMSIEDLLCRTNHEDKAQWLANKRTIVNNGTKDEIHVAIMDIRSHIYGMGSLSDLYLRSIPETSLTSVEARKVLLGLLEHFYKQTTSFLTCTDL